MSYSRWGNSYWYTFWAVEPEGTTETADNAAFEVMLIRRFTAKEIRDDIDACVSKAAKIANQTKDPPTSGDIEELKELMQRFLKDVDFEYGIKK